MIFIQKADKARDDGDLLRPVKKNQAIRVSELSKYYKIYKSPKYKLKEIFYGGKKTFHRKFWALQDISLEVKKGDCVGIIGRNGSGKSTMLQIIAGIVFPNKGIVEINGRVAALLELGAGFNPEFTGKENVYLNATIFGLSKDEIDEKYSDIVGFADIGEHIDHPVKNYSSGMYVRLAFAVAINVVPDIFIIDEALSVGDVMFQSKCYDKLKQLINQGVTILFVSHDMNAVKTLCDKVVFLKEGTIREVGSPSEVIEKYYMDIRKDQKNKIAEHPSMIVKESKGISNNFSFGTNQGRVITAEFVNTKSFRSLVSPKGTVQIFIEVEYARTVKQPSLSLIIQDQKSIEIGGKYVFLSKKYQENGLCKNRLLFTFKPKLRSGEYLITIRLEDRDSPESFFPIDKQIGALIMGVLPDEDWQLVGLFDFQIKHQELK